MNQNQTVNPSNLTQEPKPKSNLWLILVVILVLVITGAYLYFMMNKSVNPIHNNPQPQKTDNIKTTVDANNYFGFNIFDNLLKTTTTDNLFISPLSLSMALTMTANGANSQTLTEMQKVLGLSSLNLAQVNQSNQVLIQSFNQVAPTPAPTPDFLESMQKGDKPVFRIANSLWADKKYSFLPNFVQICQNQYQAESRTLDFSDPKSLDTINSWVSDKTNGKIHQVLSELNSQLYLINAVYLKASWLKVFDAELTKNDKFNFEDGTNKQVAFMNQSDTYNYYENKDLQIISLPYLGGKYNMQVLLPKNNTKIEDFIQNLSWESYTGLVSKEDSREGKVKLPKFKIEFGGDITKNLQNLGLVNTTSGQADFSKMSRDPMEIGAVIHKTYITTDEKGTEAAAATVIAMSTTSASTPKIQPIPFVFNTDHPFFFTIEESLTHQIIFMGMVANPSI